MIKEEEVVMVEEEEDEERFLVSYSTVSVSRRQ
jgi:hypothetical protein